MKFHSKAFTQHSLFHDYPLRRVSCLSSFSWGASGVRSVGEWRKLLRPGRRRRRRASPAARSRLGDVDAERSCRATMTLRKSNESMSSWSRSGRSARRVGVGLRRDGNELAEAWRISSWRHSFPAPGAGGRSQRGTATAMTVGDAVIRGERREHRRMSARPRRPRPTAAPGPRRTRRSRPAAG